MMVEKNDINANQVLEKEINLIERKQSNSNQNNNSNNNYDINGKRISSVSLSRLNVNYEKETISSNSSAGNITNHNSINNNNTKINNKNREKTFIFGKMNKSLNNNNNSNINNSSTVTRLNDKNSPFQYIKAQLAYKHYEILYKPKNFRAGILPVEENISDYTNLQLENNKKKMNMTLKNISNNNSSKFKPISSKLVPNNSKKNNSSNSSFNDNKSYHNNQNEITSNSLTKLDYVKSMVVNTTSSKSFKQNDQETPRIKTTSTNNSKKLESLYHDHPSLLPYINKRYDNDLNSLSNQPSFFLNYKQSPCYQSINDNEASTLNFGKGLKISTAAPKNWLKQKYSGSKQDSHSLSTSLSNHRISKSIFLVKNQS